MMMKKIIFLALALASLSLSSCKQDSLDLELPTPPGIAQGKELGLSLSNPSDEGASLSLLGKETSSLDLKLKINKLTSDYMPTILTQGELKSYMKAFARRLGVPEVYLLPEDCFELQVPTIKAGQTEGTISIKLVDYEKLPFGTHYIPVVVKDGMLETSYLIRVEKDGDYVKLTEEHKKPLPPNHKDKYTEPLKMIAYVETNNWDIRNMGQFILKDTKEPVFDMVVLFAANMNYDAKNQKRYIFFNDKLQPIIKNPELYIKPLQDRGIKVIIDILPNHQGVGYNNFQSYDEALEFAREAKMWTDKLGIDGWDIDEEYAEYHKQPQLYTNGRSGLWYARAMKEVMPDKLLTAYDFGLPFYSFSTDEHGKKAKDYIDFIVSNYYVRSTNSIGLARKQYAANSIEANGGTGGAGYAAAYNLQEGNGGLMFFNIRGDEIRSGDTAKNLSEATQHFYGQDCIFSGKYHKGPNDY